jgi:drug/metabolite transporter (DMT)-like permease
MPTERQATGIRLWLAMAVIYVVWGSTYFGIAVAIQTIPPFFMSASRFLIAGLALLSWDLVRSPQARHRPTARQLRDSAIVGALLLGIGNGFVALAEGLTVPTGIAAILIGMMPVWFAIFGWIYFRERLPRVVALGVVVGFAGVAALVWPSGAGSNSFNPLGLGILLLAPLGWGHGSLFAARRADLPKRPITASALQMLFGGGFLLLEGLLTGEPARFHPESISFASFAGLAYLTVFGSMLAFTVYGWLLRHAPISLVSTYAYVNPVVAVALGTIFLHEPISARTLIASAVIVGAVALIVTARGRQSRAAASSGSASDSPARTVRPPTLPGMPTAVSRVPAPPRAPSG